MLLPKPPSLQEIEAHIPRIEPVSSDVHRPLWSVMIPTYNSGDYLRRALGSVLSQAPGPNEMQIAVVDGCSDRDDPKRIVEEIGGGRVEFYRLPENRGPSTTFNSCLQYSRGYWVHLLHGDDVVLPDFYRTYSNAISDYPDAVLIVGGVSVIDQNDEITGDSPREDVEGVGILKDFASKQRYQQMAWAAPSVVVRRSTYEAAGGFCTWFDHALDMEMWLRAALQGDVVGIRQPCALSRQHSLSATSSAVVTGENIRERVSLTLLNHSRYPAPAWGKATREWKREVARYAIRSAWQADRCGSTRGRLVQAVWAFRLTPGARSLWFLAKSWLKHIRNGQG